MEESGSAAVQPDRDVQTERKVEPESYLRYVLTS